MAKFIIQASETVFYWKEVEAESLDKLRDSISMGEVYIDSNDITDGDDFQIQSIEEAEHE